MRALRWRGKGDVRIDTVPDPKIQHPRDAIIKITACAICGSDLHLLDGYQPTMESGDILGHENMGEVIELGSEVTNLKIDNRVIVRYSSRTFFRPATWPPSTRRSSRATRSRSGAVVRWASSPSAPRSCWEPVE